MENKIEAWLTLREYKARRHLELTQEIVDSQADVVKLIALVRHYKEAYYATDEYPSPRINKEALEIIGALIK